MLKAKSQLQLCRQALAERRVDAALVATSLMEQHIAQAELGHDFYPYRESIAAEHRLLAEKRKEAIEGSTKARRASRDENISKLAGMKPGERTRVPAADLGVSERTKRRYLSALKKGEPDAT